MAAKVIDLTAYRKSKRGKRKSKNENVVDSNEIGDLCHQRRLKAVRKSGEALKGRNFSRDLMNQIFGPDESPEDFGLLGPNLCLDNPNFPYHADENTSVEDANQWIDNILDDERDGD